MSHELTPLWLKFCREIQAISQTGLAFTENEFEKQRYVRLSEIAAEMTNSVSQINYDTLAESFRLQKGYATPKIDVRGAVIKDGKILLVQERSDHAWCMPGGWVDVGEAPAQSVVREVREESGFIVSAQKIVGVFDANRSGRPMEFFHAFKIVFLCELLGGEAQPSNETCAVGFYEFEKLPELSQNRTNKRHLKVIQAHLKNPNTPVFFD
ncbi:NUDIX hydrolase [candidate division KSB1 bacterium]|nr:NUDIX hydrolase [candidate division KSB1 bacterium]